MRIAITMEGGIIQGIFTELPNKGIEIAVVDFDTDGSDGTVKFAGDDCVAWSYGIEVAPKTVAMAFDAVAASDVERERIDTLTNEG